MSNPSPAAHDVITVRGAREHNLRAVDVEIPKRRLTVFTGVSGSGKSSLVFGTVAAESRRLINETYSAFVQGFMPAAPRPDADVLDGLTTAIVVDQEGMGANPRSTVGTATDAHAMLRTLFSRAGSPHVGGPNAFSFNTATVRGGGAITTEKAGGRTEKKVVRRWTRLGGMCPECEGTGRITDLDLAELLDPEKSVREGAIRAPGYSGGGWNVRLYAESGFIDPDLPVGRFTPQQLQDFLHHEPVRMKIAGINMTYEGLIPRLRGSLLSKDKEGMQKHVREFADRVVAYRTCPACQGSRLNPEALSCRIDGMNIAQLCRMQITDLAAWLRGREIPGAGPLVQGLQELLDSFEDIGLGYLSLDRPTGTLSGGEAQRTTMVRHLGSALTDVTYVFDEPSTGLHPHDVARLNRLLLRLRDKGNTVLVVEHKPEIIAVADHVVDLGPGAGAQGGRIVYQGDVAGLRTADTATGRHLQDRRAPRSSTREPTGFLRITGADRHNLRDVAVDVPLGVLTVVTGVAGSGKSTLVRTYLPAARRTDARGRLLQGGEGAASTGSSAAAPGVVLVDQSSIRGSRRSSPATYTGLVEPVRKAFAKAHGVKPGMFSSNSEGACPACHGAGTEFMDLGALGTVATTCLECEGRRFQPEVLAMTLGGPAGRGGLDIAQVLDLSAAEALEFFSGRAPREGLPVPEAAASVPAAVRILERLVEVGLGYLGIGQDLSSLSGGERQRLKLAVHLGEKGEVLVLDEPTAGLHLADVGQLLELLDRLVEAGRSVVVVEHHQAVVAHADRIIDLGPGAGHEGGQVVFQGTPTELLRTVDTPGETLTGRCLAEYLGDPEKS